MPKGEILGEFEQIVMLAILRLGEGAYGMQVRREIAGRTGRDVSIGAVYSTMDRLTEKGLVCSAWENPAPARSRRARRTFSLTVDGAKALNRAYSDLLKMVDGLSLPLPDGRITG